MLADLLSERYEANGGGSWENERTATLGSSLSASIRSVVQRETTTIIVSEATIGVELSTVSERLVTQDGQILRRLFR